MKKEISIKSMKYYLLCLGIGFGINFFLLITICLFFDFHYKSAYSLYFISFPSYFIKSLIFFLPIFALSIKKIANTSSVRVFICLSPFVLHLSYYIFLIVFEITSLYYEFSYGYIQRFPHFYIQLLSTFIASFIVLTRINKKAKRALGSPL